MLKKCKKLASAKNGECLSEYINCYTKLTWKCSKGHEWETTYSSISRGSWCPKCRINDNRRKMWGKCKKLASAKNGECLSEYINAHEPIIWKCKVGHIWKSNYNNIYNGNWCPYCSNNAPLTIEKLQLNVEVIVYPKNIKPTIY